MEIICYLSNGYPTIEASYNMAVEYADAGCRMMEVDFPSRNPYLESDYIAGRMKKALEACDDYEKYMKGQYVTVSNLLNDYYNMNLLPNPYRNLASVYYIYDYMSSSQESLQDTFVHEHMENGIQRIISKLDYIIEQNEQIIFSNRILESQNESIKQQNCNMLSSLENIENNSVLCAQYAELAANYTKANAYFSLASYLQNI